MLRASQQQLHLCCVVYTDSMPTSALYFCSDAVCVLQGRDYWARFERFVKTLAWSSDDVYIVTGPLYVPQRTPQGYVMHHPMIGMSHSHKHFCSSRLHAGLFVWILL